MDTLHSLRMVMKADPSNLQLIRSYLQSLGFTLDPDFPPLFAKAYLQSLAADTLHQAGLFTQAEADPYAKAWDRQIPAYDDLLEMLEQNSGERAATQASIQATQARIEELKAEIKAMQS